MAGTRANGWCVTTPATPARFFQDPGTHQWHSLRWVGLLPDGEVPAFSDGRVRDMLAAARRAGLRPRSDTELLTLLLELIGAHIPVEAWPTRMGKTERTAHAREATQAKTATADRPARGATAPTATAALAPVVASTGPATGEPGWQLRARQTQHAVDDDRAARRRQALTDAQVSTPSRLGDGFRRGNLFLLPAADRDDPADAS